MTTYYFGFGSNLDYEDWSLFCREQGFDPDVLRPVGTATLPGERLVSTTARPADDAAL